MPSCGSCKQPVLKTNIMCKQCRCINYCSEACQTKHTAIHQRTCKPEKVVGWGPDSMIMRLNGPGNKLPGGPPVVKHGFKKLPPNSIGGIGEDWTSDLPRNATLYERTYERLINSYRLRVEDIKVHGGENFGLYQKGVDPLAHFIDYIKQAKRKRLLPAWWNAQCDKQLLHLAKARVSTTTNKKNVADERGPFEPMVLRMMAEKIYGMPLMIRQ